VGTLCASPCSLMFHAKTHAEMKFQGWATRGSRAQVLCTCHTYLHHLACTRHPILCYSFSQVVANAW
jgi:hypothetical protein